MATGKIHGTATIGSSVGVLSGFLLSSVYTTEQIFIVFVGTLLGLIIGPDLDVDEGWRGDYLLRALHIEWVYDLFWEAYRHAIKHRSPLSHFPVLGTLIRILYLFIPLQVLVIKDQPTPHLKLFLHAFPAQLVSIVFWFLAWYFWFYIPYVAPPLITGIIISDTLHWIYDFKWMKRFY